MWEAWFHVGQYGVCLHDLLNLGAGGAALLLGLWVFLAHRRTREGSIFLLFAFAAAIWMLADGFSSASPTAEIAQRWVELQYVGGAIVPLVAYLFTVELQGLLEERRGYVALLGFATLGAMGLSVAPEVLIQEMTRTPWGWRPVYAPVVGPLYLSGSVVAFTMIVVEWWLGWRRAETAVERRRAGWFFWAFVLMLPTLADYLPGLGVEIYPLGYLFQLALMGVLFVGLRRYRLLDLTRQQVPEQVFRNLSEALFVCADGGEIRATNPAVERLLGYTEADLLGDDVTKVGLDRERMRVWQRDQQGERYETELRGADGSPVAVSVQVEPLVDGGEPVGAIVVARDIRRRKEAEQKLEETRRRYELVAKGANDGIWDWDLETDEVYYSQRWKDELGYEAETVGTSTEEWFGRIHDEDRLRVQEKLMAHLERETNHFQAEYRIRDADGAWRWMLCRGIAVRDEGGRPVRMAGSQTDITERKVLEEQMIHGAFHDELTGLPNRSLFLDRVGRLLEQRRRYEDRGFSVCILDVDRFKMINDSLGHGAGDAVLQEVAERLRDTLREADTVARIGSDEFGLILSDTGDSLATAKVSDRVQEEIERPIQLEGRDGQEVFVSASLGVAIVGGEREYSGARDILRDADVAMYSAKVDSAKHVAVFNSGMYEAVTNKLELESALRQALEEDELTVHYQPIVSVETGAWTGVEALVRWEHPEYGQISPGEFVPVAEETGLIVELDGWVLQRACDEVADWISQGLVDGGFTVHVNVSAREFAGDGPHTKITEFVEGCGLPEGCLQIEITERLLMKKSEKVVPKLEALAAMGVGIAIDDFGTGYSSLSYLREFPVDTVKIDREFIKSVHHNDEDREIVRSVVELADKLGLDLVAEGVETDEQLALLKGLAVPQGQGFLWARPAPAEDIMVKLGTAVSSR